MNDVVELQQAELFSPEVSAEVDELSQDIRALVSTARICIIEVGRKLIVAKTKVGHGNWLPWLKDEFGWTERTARNFMQVADAFKSAIVSDFTGLTIDVTALYALAAPDVPQSARDEAVNQAEAGDHVTKADAEALIADAMRVEKEKFEATVARIRAEAAAATIQAIDNATKQLAHDNEALAAEIERIHGAAIKPDIPTLVEELCKATGQKKLKPKQFQALACILDTAITDGKKVYPPSTEEESRKAEEDLSISAPAMRALEYFLAAPQPDVVLKSLRPFQIETARRCFTTALPWLAGLEANLGGK